jgi:hypothetical protein
MSFHFDGSSFVVYFTNFIFFEFILFTISQYLWCIMTNFILIFVFFIARHCIATCKMVSNHAYTVLNKIVIYVCLPALALYYIPKINWSPELLYPIGGLVL